jgi:hypothetical protein
VPAELRRLGWVIHCIVDEFPNNAETVADEEWIEHGVVRGWVPL